MQEPVQLNEDFDYGWRTKAATVPEVDGTADGENGEVEESEEVEDVVDDMSQGEAAGSQVGGVGVSPLVAIKEAVVPSRLLHPSRLSSAGRCPSKC